MKYPLEKIFGPARFVEVETNSLYMKMCRAANKDGPNLRLQLTALALDPGETTGVAYWTPFTPEGNFLPDARSRMLLWQLETKDIGQSFVMMRDALAEEQPDHLRAEDYKVYGWKANEHAFASLHTARWLGAIEAAAHVTETPFTVKLAQHAKTWWTDDKLKACGVYVPGMKHARDAQRHLSYYLAFGA